MDKSFSRKRLLPCLLLILLALGSLTAIGFKKGVFITENQKFEQFIDQLFLAEVSSNTLNLHYTLAYPEEYGIEDCPVSVGSLNVSEIPASYAALENYQKALHSYNYSKLSEENQMTYDILDLDFTTQLSLGNNYMLMEVLSPSLGVQAQLPVLLAEYTFRSKQDIDNYLALLTSIPQYFDEIINFEKTKSARGVFMSDTTVDRIVAQCNSFIDSSSPNYLSIMFEENLRNFTPEDSKNSSQTLSEKEISKYIESHQSIMETQVFPAYSNLIAGLEQLKGTGENDNGLYYFQGGTDYYQYLVQNNTGIYTSMDEMEKRLYKQLLSDYEEMQRLLKDNPDLLTAVTNMESTTSSNSADSSNPDVPLQMLETLQEKILEDFPEIEETSYEVKYVHSSLEEFLSPAFYLTPPIDTQSPNVIYINNGSASTDIDLFTTLAHEGFPGHLYQTHYFAQQEPSNIRHLLSNGGYIEGWATYIESYAYGYLDEDPALTRFLWLNRSLNLCLYSIMDIGIHNQGWTLKTVNTYLSSFGITNEEIVQEIFQYIVENPTNYLKYYMGYLSFEDIKAESQESLGEDFDLKEFHKEVLELGPSQFPVLQKYLVGSGT